MFCALTKSIWLQIPVFILPQACVHLFFDSRTLNFLVAKFETCFDIFC